MTEVRLTEKGQLMALLLKRYNMAWDDALDMIEALDKEYEVE